MCSGYRTSSGSKLTHSRDSRKGEGSAEEEVPGYGRGWGSVAGVCVRWCAHACRCARIEGAASGREVAGREDVVQT